ncbi:DNA-directed RNA polymerase subunit H [Candidatus Woesearchaeota archaeon]|nr:DNA-directed RNA polymerase subunit H [Candidatus Woesearchaeota archaeon]
MKKIDLTTHVLIPKHSKLGDKDKEEMLKRYNVSLKGLPKILVSDAGISHLSARPGDVIEIVRDSPTAGKAFFYRVVVDE